MLQVHKYKVVDEGLFLRNKAGEESGWGYVGYWYKHNFDSSLFSGYKMTSSGLLFDAPLHRWTDK